MSSLARVAWAFLKRDLLSVRPWRWAIESVDASLTVVIWYYVSRFFGAARLFPSGDASDYFTFSLIGLALTQYVWRGFYVFADRVRTEQASGALEPLCVTATPFPLSVALSGIWDFLSATVHAGIVLLVGTYGFGAALQWGGILTVLGVGLLTSVSMASLGLLAASWVIASGRGDVLRPLLNKVIPLLSGAFFPIGLFPEWLKAIAWCLPLTHALTLARGVLIPSEEVAMWGGWVMFFGMTGCFMLAGWGSLILALRQARMNGRIASA